ncbi:MAG: efflux RND transporter permease subunit [Hyphomicrobiaceae bacterium]
MNFALPFIRRPIGTTLMAIGLFLAGAVAYVFLPVASLPSVEFPTVRVSASRPGADPETMAATVAAPLERRLGEIAGVTELTSVSSLGTTNITIQFDLSRNVDGAAQDVQAALNAAAADLPSDLPTLPTFRKANPAAAPVLILALTSKTIPPSAIYDVADTVIAQRISQVDGVADVTVSGAEQPAIRVQLNPGVLSSMGVGFDDVRAAISAANVMAPVGTFDGSHVAETIAVNGQLRTAEDYGRVVVKTRDGTVVRLSAIADIKQATRNNRSAAWFNRQPAVLLIVTKQGDANVIDTVDRVYDLLPELKRWIPEDVDISVLSDRTKTIRASVHDMQITLGLTILLVMLVVFVFLRRGPATIAAGITVPLSLAGTCGLMWLAGYSINNLTLMALAVSVGFVVDDAIVMIENSFRRLEAGRSPLRATVEGARQIGFTVVSISISLVAAFIPLLFMGGIVGRLFREFSITLVFAIVVSTLVSLSVTPMVCAYFVKDAPSRDATRFDRIVERALAHLIDFYRYTLGWALRWRGLTFLVMLGTIALTVALFIKVPKGYFPQDDTGLVFGSTRASADISFQAMSELQQRVAEIVMADPAVAALGSSVGASGFNASVNQGRLFISLKPMSETHETTAEVIARLRPKLLRVGGMQVFMVPAQDIRAGGRSSRSQYQFTFWSPEIGDLRTWTPRIVERLQSLDGLTDVSNDREQGGLQVNISIDRPAAARLGVDIADIDSALNNAFAQRQITTVYTQRNQYRVILEATPGFQRDPTDLDRIFVTGTGGAQIPLSSVTNYTKGLAPLVVNHQGQFPSVTVSYNLAPGIGLEEAQARIQRAVAELHMPDTIHAEPAGDAQQFSRVVSAQPILILAAFLAVYIVLGVLYESLAHPLTIISTLPSAGLGALLALRLADMELTVIALIGVILLIGIVKKNGIMLVDFALEAERQKGMSPEDAIFTACIERFRPILMTTMAAMLGAIPLILATGPGSELRRPLGITIFGGLIVSQLLTLYTTPVIYLLLDKLHRRLWGTASPSRWRVPAQPTA